MVARSWRLVSKGFGWLVVLVLTAAIVGILVIQSRIPPAGVPLLEGAAQSCSSYLHTRGTDAAGLPKGPVTLTDLESRAESKLVPPRATVVSYSPVAYGYTCNLSPVAAWSMTRLETLDSIETVNAWYTSHLTSNGWRKCPASLTAGTPNEVFVRGSRAVYSVSWPQQSASNSPEASAAPASLSVTYTISKANPSASPAC